MFPIGKPFLNVIVAFLIAFVSLQVKIERVQAQESQVRFERLSIEDGLSHNNVHVIHQDQLGLMWFGTDEGLNRYDGYTFSVYQHDPEDAQSLGNNIIFALEEDAQGFIWVGTGEGLDRFERESETFTHYGYEGTDTFGTVQALEIDTVGNLWIGTANRGLWVFDLSSGSLSQYHNDPQEADSLASDSVNDILCVQSGDIWVATGNGLELLPKGQTGFHHYQHNISNPNSPTSNRVLSLWEDQAGFLWVGTDGGGLNRLDRGTGTFTFYLNSSVDAHSISDNHVQAMYEDAQNTLWVATLSGLNRFDYERNQFTRYYYDPEYNESLGSSQILTLFEDYSGNLWIGTRGGGLSIYKPGAHKFGRYNMEFPNSTHSDQTITAILEDSHQSVWVGTMQGGLGVLNPGDENWKIYRSSKDASNGLSSDAITALAEDMYGNIWIGTSAGGLNMLDRGQDQFIHYRYAYNDLNSLSSNSISALFFDHQNSLWVGNMVTGLDRLDPAKKEFSHYRYNPQDPASISSDQITVIYQDQQNYLWVGTWLGGLNRFDPQTQKFQRFQHDPQDVNSLSSDQILSLLEAPQGVLWVGTKEGLNQIDLATGQINHYITRDGLPANTIYCLLADEEGRLWISTTNGLSRFDPQEQLFRNYTVEDGLQNQEFIPGSCVKSTQGELFFGGVQGYNAFLPAEIHDSQAPPKIVIISFKKQNQTILRDLTGAESIQLSYRDGDISFEFAALDYFAPQKNQYAYKLDGFDQEWIEADTQRLARYTNLPGGSYVFRVRATNGDGIWNNDGLAIPVRVTPPIWENGWFMVVAAILVASSLYTGYRFRMRSIQHRNLELERKVQELSLQVKEAAIAAERNRVARDLHDSVTQSLYSLSLMAEAGLRLLEAGKLADSQVYLQRLGQIAQQALQEMRLMVYDLRRPDWEETGLVGALENRLEAVERRSGVRARLIVEGELSLDKSIEAGLYLLAQEALNNALKHSSADSVMVSLRNDVDSLDFEVTDNGRGFDSEAISSGGFGLISMRERAEQMGGRLTIQSSPGEGTSIHFHREARA